MLDDKNLQYKKSFLDVCNLEKTIFKNILIIMKVKNFFKKFKMFPETVLSNLFVVTWGE